MSYNIKTKETFTKINNNTTYSYSVDIKASLNIINGSAIYETTRKVVVEVTDRINATASFTIRSVITKSGENVSISDLQSNLTESELNIAKSAALGHLDLDKAVLTINEKPELIELMDFNFNEWKSGNNN